jgi:hypothetical protein
MLVNEFDLKLDDEFSITDKKENEYYWLINRDRVSTGLVSHIIYKLRWAKRSKEKQVISISPVFKIIF